MVTKTFVDELVADAHVQTIFMVLERSLRLTRTNKEYLSLTLGDRTGRIEARAWDNARAMASRFEVEDFIVLHGIVERYQEDLQIKLLDLERVDEADVRLADFLPASRWEPEALFAQLKDLILDEVEDPTMRRFFRALFGHQELMDQFKMAPAAKANHHDFLAGLIEHTLSMARVACALTRHYALYYPGLVRKDLVLAGCVLHDMGKCQELMWQRRIGYSQQGELVGHIVRGVEIINEVVARMAPAPPPELVLELKHLVVSHHGKQEYGAPIEPKTPEALLLHQIDMTDSRMNMLWKAHQTLDEAPYLEGKWTTARPIGRMYFGPGPGASVIAQDMAMLQGPGLLRTPTRPGAASTTRGHTPATTRDTPTSRAALAEPVETPATPVSTPPTSRAAHAHGGVKKTKNLSLFGEGDPS